MRDFFAREELASGSSSGRSGWVLLRLPVVRVAAEEPAVGSGVASIADGFIWMSSGGSSMRVCEATGEAEWPTHLRVDQYWP